MEIKMKPFYYLVICILLFNTSGIAQCYCTDSIPVLKKKVIQLKLLFEDVRNKGSAIELLKEIKNNLKDTSKCETEAFRCFEANLFNNLESSIEAPFYTNNKRFRSILRTHSYFFERINLLQDPTEIPKAQDIDSLIAAATASLTTSIASAVTRTIDSINENSKRIQEVKEVADNTIQKIKYIEDKIDTLLIGYKLQSRNIICISFFHNKLYGISYGRSFKSNLLFFDGFWSVEVLIPINSTDYHSPGYVGNAGFYYKHFLFQAGAGFLESSVSEKIFMKGSLDFINKRIGMGITYSPLTKTGIRLSYLF